MILVGSSKSTIEMIQEASRPLYEDLLNEVTTRFLFVVFKRDENNILHLKGGQFWNIPYNDLEGNVKKVWEETKQVLIDGLQITCVNGKKYNNFPKAKDNSVSHVRPHGQNAKDTYELPDGRQYTKQCFWLNRDYILSQLDEKFLK